MRPPGERRKPAGSPPIRPAAAVRATVRRVSPVALPFLLFALVAGAAVAIQSPINAALARATGQLEAALVSFSVGGAVLALAVLVFGKGQLRQVAAVPPWQLAGGLCGAFYVASIVVVAPRLGVTGMIAASLLGQVIAALTIDANGWFGLAARPIDGARLAGVALLVAATALINWTR